LPPETVQDDKFITFYLNVVNSICNNFRPNRASNIFHGIIKYLLKIIDQEPVDGKYVYHPSHVSIAARSLSQIIKSNFDTFHAVERIIGRLIAEIRTLESMKDRDLKTVTILGKEVEHKQRREMIRVLYRLLGNSIFKNDNNMAHLNPNYTPNARKILNSDLFHENLRLQEKIAEEKASDII